MPRRIPETDSEHSTDDDYDGQSGSESEEETREERRERKAKARKESDANRRLYAIQGKAGIEANCERAATFHERMVADLDPDERARYEAMPLVEQLRYKPPRRKRPVNKLNISGKRTNFYNDEAGKNNQELMVPSRTASIWSEVEDALRPPPRGRRERETSGAAALREQLAVRPPDSSDDEEEEPELSRADIARQALAAGFVPDKYTGAWRPGKPGRVPRYYTDEYLKSLGGEEAAPAAVEQAIDGLLQEAGNSLDEAQRLAMRAKLQAAMDRLAAPEPAPAPTEDEVPKEERSIFETPNDQLPPNVRRDRPPKKRVDRPSVATTTIPPSAPAVRQEREAHRSPTLDAMLDDELVTRTCAAIQNSPSSDVGSQLLVAVTNEELRTDDGLKEPSPPVTANPSWRIRAVPKKNKLPTVTSCAV